LPIKELKGGSVPHETHTVCRVDGNASSLWLRIDLQRAGNCHRRQPGGRGANPGGGFMVLVFRDAVRLGLGDARPRQRKFVSGRLLCASRLRVSRQGIDRGQSGGRRHAGEAFTRKDGDHHGEAEIQLRRAADGRRRRGCRSYGGGGGVGIAPGWVASH